MAQAPKSTQKKTSTAKKTTEDPKEFHFHLGFLVLVPSSKNLFLDVSLF